MKRYRQAIQSKEHSSQITIYATNNGKNGIATIHLRFRHRRWSIRYELTAANKPNWSSLKRVRKVIFLGGACGESTWRRDVAIPLLKAAGISFHDPQLASGAWTEADEIEDMRAKAEAEVLLFVISEATRGVASVAEVAYLIASGRPLALCLRMIPGASQEIDDLNRGRIFLKTMAAGHDIPVFATEKDATEYAISLLARRRSPMTEERVRALLANISCGDLQFAVDGMRLRLERSGGLTGRWWLIEPGASESDVVRTAFKAAITWEEHELRERFLYKGAAVFGPHFEIDRLLRSS